MQYHTTKSQSYDETNKEQISGKNNQGGGKNEKNTIKGMKGGLNQ